VLPSAAVHRPHKSVVRQTPGLTPVHGALHCSGDPGGTQMPVPPAEQLNGEGG